MILVITKHLKSYYKKITVKDAEINQSEFNAVICVSKKYVPKKDKYIETKNKFLANVENFYKGREKIIEGFKNRVFSFNYDKGFEERLKCKTSISNENVLIDHEKLDRLIDLKKRDIGDEFLKKHFQVNSLNDILKELKK